MITNPSQKYSKLFRAAYTLLDEKNLLREETKTNKGITSLEEYFTYIGDLKAMHDAVVRGTLSVGGGGDRDEWNTRFAQYAKYLMLPINEDYFVINANTRTISIPAIFAANGVGLAGDSWAETLMFEIDRYFDYVDLMRTNIYIQWTNTDGTDGSTLINLIDYDDQKIRLGWPLSSAVTAEHDGNLTFSIRFFMRDPTNPETIIYSLNILPINVKIRKPLRLGIESNYTDEHPYLFMSAIKNGVLSSEINGFAEYAIISSQLPAGDSINLTNENKQTLTVSSYTTDNGSLSYSWEFKPENAEEFLILDATNSEQYGITVSDGGYRLTEDATPVRNKVYYIEIGENAYAACDKDEDFTEAGDFIDGTEYYESYAYCTITDTDKSIVGTYAATISNRVAGKAPATTRTNNWIIPSPKEITYNSDLSVSNNILTEVYEETQDTEYDTSKTYYIKIEDNQYEAVVDITEFEPDVVYYEKNNLLTLQVTATPDNDHADLSYAWYFTNNENNDMVLIENAITRTYDANQPGWYQVKITSTLNREQIEKDSQIAKVTLPPMAPTIEYQGGANKIVNINLSNAGDESILEVKAEILTGPLSSEELSYTWMHQTKEADNEYEDAVVGQYGVREISGNKLTVSYANSQEIFICKVTNHLNGAEAFSYSDKYNIMKV